MSRAIRTYSHRFGGAGKVSSHRAQWGFAGIGGCQPPRGAQFPVPEAEIPCSRGKGCLKFPVPNEQGILTKRGATPDSYAVENAARSAEI